MDFNTTTIVQFSYLLAIILFIVGLKRLSSPATARSGNQLAAVGMLVGVVATLVGQGILGYEFIIAGILIGTVIGAVLARRIEMTSMPEMVASSMDLAVLHQLWLPWLSFTQPMTLS